MFEVEYPGKCFGTFEDSKECKKCRIKQYCKTPKQCNGKTGIEVLKDLSIEAGTIVLKPTENIRASCAFLKGSIDFMEDGKICIRKNGEEQKEIKHIVSAEEALSIFNSLIEG